MFAAVGCGILFLKEAQKSTRWFLRFIILSDFLKGLRIIKIVLINHFKISTNYLLVGSLFLVATDFLFQARDQISLLIRQLFFIFSALVHITFLVLLVFNGELLFQGFIKTRPLLCTDLELLRIRYCLLKCVHEIPRNGFVP